MTNIPMAPSIEQLPENIEYWVSEARALKEIADQGWSAERKVSERLKLFYGTLHKTELHDSMETMRVELNFLYGSLISLAIQHLAIGILIVREPTRFLLQPPGHKIVELVEACGLAMTEQQIRLLRHTENALGWRNYFPAIRKKSDARDVVQGLDRILADMDVISDDEKMSLERLYSGLEAMARVLLTSGSADES